MSSSGTGALIPGVDIDIEDGETTKPPLTAERLRELVDYDPEEGIMIWRENRRGRRVRGTIAGSVGRGGYLIIKIDGRSYRRGRLAFLYMTGEWPEHECDHIDGAVDNDRWSNLRSATRAQNRRNQVMPNRNGVRGVVYRPDCRRPYVARIREGERLRIIGYFDTAGEAATAYAAAAALRDAEFDPDSRPPVPDYHVPSGDLKLGYMIAEKMLEAEASEAATARTVAE